MNHVFFKRYTHVRLKRYTHEQMSLTYWFVFVYDREEKDVLRVKELNGKYLNRAITPEEKEEWMAGIKGALNVLDLQRIEWNTRLIGEFELLKLTVKTKGWKYGDIPKVSDFIRILDNVQKIRDAWALMSGTPNTPTLPLTTYQKWNDIEKIMHDISFTYGRSVEDISYCGELYAGEGIGTIRVPDRGQLFREKHE